jgi:hypothetical protein
VTTLKRLLTWAVLVVGAGSLAAQTMAPAADAPGSLKFEDVTDQTGLPQIMKAWKDEQEASQEQAHQGTRDSGWWWPTALSAGDFTGSGRPDIVFAHHGSPGTRIFFNASTDRARLLFEDRTKARTLSGSFALMAADGSTYVFDVNGDGFPDVASFSDESAAWAALNDGAGRFNVQKMPFRFAQGLLADADGDGRIDVLGLLPPFTLLLNKGQGKYEAARSAPGSRFLELTPEMILPGMATPDARGNLNPGPYTASRVDLGRRGGNAILATLGSGYGAQRVVVLRPNAAGAYEDVTASMGLPAAGRVSGLYDFNGDGLTDVLVTASQQSGTYLNDGQGRFGRSLDGLARDLSASPDPATTLDSLADFDEDGKPELLIVTFRFARQSGLYRNAGGGGFERVAGLELPAWQFVVCDMDGDGRLDILAGTNAGPRVFLNRTPAAGNFINVRLKGPPENLVGLDAVVEAYRPRGLGQAASLIARVRNNTEGIPAHLSVCGIGHSYGGNLPVHLGLGKADTVDLRVTFPGGKVVELKDVKTNQTVSAAFAPSTSRPASARGTA